MQPPNGTVSAGIAAGRVFSGVFIIFMIAGVRPGGSFIGGVAASSDMHANALRHEKTPRFISCIPPLRALEKGRPFSGWVSAELHMHGVGNVPRVNVVVRSPVSGMAEWFIPDIDVVDRVTRQRF